MPPSKIEVFAEANRGRQVIYKTNEDYQGIIIGWHRGKIIIYRVFNGNKINLIDHTIYDHKRAGHIFVNKDDFDNNYIFMYYWSMSSFNFVANKNEIADIINKLEL